jgi:uncharacterized protein YbjT (DUF2867 family)
MSETIFVSGATGTTGGATARALRARGAKVVVGVRTPDKSGPLEAIGATVRQFDLADPSGMTDAMRGADRLYLVTPVSERTAALTEAVIAAAKAAGVRHAVKLSGLDVDKEPRFTMGRWHHAAEKAIQASGLEWTFLRANAFMQNFLGNAGTIKNTGSYFSPFGSTPVCFIDAEDIGEVAATVLLSDGHAGNIYNLTGPRGIANDEVAKLLGEAAGRPVTCVNVTEDQLRQALAGHGMPEVVASATAELLGLMATGTAAYVSPDAEKLLGHAPRDFADWTRANAQIFR